MLSRFLIGVLCFAVVTSAIGQTAPEKPVSSVDARHWRGDLYYMANAITHYHKNAFHSVSKAAFDRAVADLNGRIPSLTRPQIIVGLKRIIAMIGDEHTGFGLSTGPPIYFHTLPVKIYKYSDGYFVQSAAPQLPFDRWTSHRRNRERLS